MTSVNPSPSPFKSVFTHSAPFFPQVQMMTVLSWPALAIYDFSSPMEGAQETSLTQSECPCKTTASSQLPDAQTPKEYVIRMRCRLEWKICSNSR